MSAVDQSTGKEVDEWNEPRRRGDGDRSHRGQRNEEEGSRRHRDPLGPPPKLHSIHKAIVGHIKEFGVFATLENSGWEGLIHISQLCDRHVESPDEVVSTGNRVWVKISEVTDDEMKKDKFRISMTMKYVDQSNGRDLDPTNEDLIEDLAGNRPTGARRRLTCDVAMKVSEHGGSASQQYGSENKKYEMLPSDDEEEIGGRGLNGSATNSAPNNLPAVGRGRGTTLPAWMTNPDATTTTKSKSKKKKKKKSKKKKKKKKKSKKKKRKRKRSDSDSSSNSDDDSSIEGEITSVEEAKRMIAALERNLAGE